MDREKQELTERKFKLPYHWMRDPLHRDSLPYFGYAQIVLEELPPAPARVLDAGCGDGRIAALIAEQGHQVSGLDFLEISAQYARIMVPAGDFRSGDLRRDLVADYGFAPGSFDAVVLIEVYEHIPPEDCPAVLANVMNLLKPGGTFLVSVPTKLVPMSNLHYRHFDPGELERELQAAGLAVEKVLGQHRVGGWADLLMGDALDNLLNNGWLQPVILKRLRRKLYQSRCNRVSPAEPCGRFIALARKPGRP
jgi:2-polyprenyl-3-methyl-5-hydroxy-6-metoxy-1,4-benzoquinol methylase